MAYGEGSPTDNEFKYQNPEFQRAASSASGTLAFITPEIAIPLLIEQVNVELAPEVYNWITSTDITIYNGSEGTLVIDGNI
jgi:hypothetical protein